MNNTRKLPQKSRVSPQNPYKTTGYHDRKITSPIEVAIGRIAVNFGKINQNDANFVARVHLLPAQKNQKTTANKARRGFTLCN